jgi:hypothetical protein
MAPLLPGITQSDECPRRDKLCNVALAAIAGRMYGTRSLIALRMTCGKARGYAVTRKLAELTVRAGFPGLIVQLGASVRGLTSLRNDYHN